MSEQPNAERRTVLKTLGAAIVGGSVVAGAAEARGNTVSKVSNSGHYAWFPLGPDSWGRSQNPVDKQQDVESQQEEARWLAKPATGGGIRCRVENLSTPFRNSDSFQMVCCIHSAGLASC